MIKQAIAIGSLLAGGASASVVAYLQARPAPQEPRGLSRAQAESTRAEPPVLTPVTVFLSDTTPLVAPEVAPKRPSNPRRVVATPAMAHEFVPCSEFREVGAAIIREGGAVGSRMVRSLCERPVLAHDPD
jgi:hypothetical protein